MRFSISVMLSLAALALFITSCTKDQLDPVNTNENGEVTGEIWTGATLSFSKAPESDPTAAQNQDRITDNVWITRGNDGGQIYNAVVEDSADKSSSPEGTAWAIGTIDEVNDLDFKPFREAVGKPKNIIGQDLVLYLIEDDVYLSVKFTEWGEQRNGAFSYERSTKE